MLAHADERLVVEAGRIDGEAEKLRRPVEVLRQRPHPAALVVAVVAEMQLDRLLVERLLEGLRIEVAGALVQHAREQHVKPGLLRRVLRRAAAHGEFERDQRNGGQFDEPEGEPARRRDGPHVDGGRSGRDGEVFLHGAFPKRRFS